MSAAIFESYDAQMLDYTGDADISMQSADLPPDFTEAYMQDEVLGDSSQYTDFESVEVDMEYHDEEIVEYEMADEDGEGTVDEELHDVELYDTSRAPSVPPPITNASQLPSDSTSTELELHHSPVPLSPSPSRLPDDSAADHLNTMEHHESHPLVINTLESAPQPEPQSSDASPVFVVAEMTAAADLAAVSFTKTSGTISPSATIEGDATTFPPISAADAMNSFVVTIESFHSREEELHRTPPDELQILGSDEIQVSSNSSEAVDGGGKHTDSDDKRGLNEVAGAATHTDQLGETFYTSASVDQTERVQEDILGSELQQLSEQAPNDDSGIGFSYDAFTIEPVSVLLSIASARPEPLECCLFRQPPAKSGSRNPSPSTSSDTFPILLDKYPTLFYDPLTEVFAMIREDQLVRSLLLDLSDGELVLDAYDLGLVISEDNISVPFLTLHNINEIHDEFQLQGPLRLRLRLAPSRFIQRYKALRTQAQLYYGDTKSALVLNPLLPIGSDGAEIDKSIQTEKHQDAEYSADALPVDDSFVDNLSTVVDPATESPQVQQSDLQEHQEQAYQEDHPEQHDDHEVEAPQLSTIGNEVKETQLADEDMHNNTTTQHEDSSHGEYDATKDHKLLDAQDGGDFTDYQEYSEDEDEQFEQDVPEETGGNEGATVGEHLSLNDQTEEPSDTNDVHEEDHLQSTIGQLDSHSDDLSVHPQNDGLELLADESTINDRNADNNGDPVYTDDNDGLEDAEGTDDGSDYYQDVESTQGDSSHQPELVVGVVNGDTITDISGHDRDLQTSFEFEEAGDDFLEETYDTSGIDHDLSLLHDHDKSFDSAITVLSKLSKRSHELVDFDDIDAELEAFPPNAPELKKQRIR